MTIVASAPLTDQNILVCNCGAVAWRIFTEQPDATGAMVECDRCHEMRRISVDTDAPIPGKHCGAGDGYRECEAPKLCAGSGHCFRA